MSASPRIIFFGTPTSAVPVLEALIASNYKPVSIVTRPAKPKGRSGQPQPSPIALVATREQIPTQTPTTLDDQFVHWLERLKPDVAVLVAYGKILPSRVLAIPRLGFINVHPSLLPRYRGPSPVQAAILNGDPESGVSIMLLDEKMDHGPVLAQEREPLRPDDTLTSLSERLFTRGAALLVEVLPDFLSGSCRPVAQNHAVATYTKLVQRASGLIDWQHSAQMIERQTRAFHPWPGAFTCWKDQRIKIVAAKVSPTQNLPNPTPGRVLVQDKRLLVLTGSGLLEITQLQPAGQRVQTAQAFLNGHHAIDGAALGAC